MGQIMYGGSPHISLGSNDEWLSALQVVMTASFEAGKGFWLTLSNDDSATAVYLSPSIPVVIAYDQPRRPDPDLKVVEGMVKALREDASGLDYVGTSDA